MAEDTVNKFELFYNQARAFYKSGMNPKVDVTIAETNLSSAKLKLIQAENRVNLAVAKLNNIMGVPYLEAYTACDKLQFKPINITFEQSVDIARNSRPELKQAEIKVEAANQTLKLAKKSYFPTLTMEGQYQIGGRTFTSTLPFASSRFLNISR